MKNLFAHISSQDHRERDLTVKELNLSRIVFSLSAIVILAKFFGFAEKIVIAQFFGTGAKADVYFAVTGIIFSIFFLVKELIYPSLLPVFTESISESIQTSTALFKKVFILCGVILSIFSLIMALFPAAFTSLLVPGFSEDKKNLTSVLLRFLSPAVVFLGLSTITYTVLNSQKKFITASLIEGGMKFFIVAGLIILIPFIDIYALAVVFTIGAGISLFLQLYFIPQSRELFKKNISQAKQQFQKMLKLTNPLVAGVIFSHISGLVANMLASTQPTGHLAYLNFSRKLIDAILLVGPVALMTVVYAQLSQLSLLATLDEFKKLFEKTLRILLYFSVPCAVLLVTLREPIIRLLFERGQFNSESTFGTSKGLFIYGIGLVTLSLESLIVYGFYALSNTKTPVKIGILCVLIDIILALSLLGPFGYLGIAWAFVISKTIKVTLLFGNLEKRLSFIYSTRLFGFIGKLALTTVIAIFVLHFLVNFNNQNPPIQSFLFDLLIPAGGFILVFILCSYLLKIEEMRYAWQILSKRKKIKYAALGDQK